MIGKQLRRATASPARALCASGEDCNLRCMYRNLSHPGPSEGRSAMMKPATAVQFEWNR